MGNRVLKHVFLATGTAALAILIVVVLVTRKRILDLEANLTRMGERLESSKREVAESRNELSATRRAAEAAWEAGTLAQRRAEAAQARAADAEQKAKKFEEARLGAESAAAQSQRDADLARAKSEHARDELEALRRRREQELNRMHEALNRIAPTTRTPLGMVVELGSDSLRFDFDRANLRPENRELLSRIAGILLASHGYRLLVYGHTDDIGTDAYNLELSRRRADSVASYFTEAGVPGDIITRKGFGKSSPRAKGSTREAREKNRRVEIGIVDTIINYDLSQPLVHAKQ